MKKGIKIWMIVGMVLIISLIGASAASARFERPLEAVVYNPVGTDSPGGYVDPTSEPTSEPTSTPPPASFDEPECSRASNCSRSTGRWIITYLRKSEGHWVTFCRLYVPNFIDNQKDAKNWRWSDDYLAENCSLPGEPQTWEGIYYNLQQERVPAPCPLICPIANYDT